MYRLTRERNKGDIQTYKREEHRGHTDIQERGTWVTHRHTRERNMGDIQTYKREEHG